MRWVARTRVLPQALESPCAGPKGPHAPRDGCSHQTEPGNCGDRGHQAGSGHHQGHPQPPLPRSHGTEFPGSSGEELVRVSQAPQTHKAARVTSHLGRGEPALSPTGGPPPITGGDREGGGWPKNGHTVVTRSVGGKEAGSLRGGVPAITPLAGQQGRGWRPGLWLCQVCKCVSFCVCLNVGVIVCAEPDSVHSHGCLGVQLGRGIGETGPNPPDGDWPTITLPVGTPPRPGLPGPAPAHPPRPPTPGDCARPTPAHAQRPPMPGDCARPAPAHAW